MAYFTNALNKMYYFENDKNKDFNVQTTGWHFIPNQRYDNWLTPRQWFDLVTNHDKFRLVSCECTVQNEIPLTDNLAIGQDTTFMNFNNTIYALGYTDKHYETAPVESTFNLLYREGVIINPVNGTVEGKQTLPLYNHPLVKKNANDTFSVYAWDPFIHANNLMELRPGKNAMSFKWEAHPSDGDKWYSTAKYFSLQSTYDDTNIPQRHTNEIGYQDEWMTLPQVMKTHPQAVDYNRLQVNVYNYIWNYPINNWFCKMIPIVDTKNGLLKHQGLIVLNRKIRFEVTPRSNTTNYPQIQNYWIDESKFTRIQGQSLLTVRYDQAIRPPDNIGQQAPSNLLEHYKYHPVTTLDTTTGATTVTYTMSTSHASSRKH